MDIFSPGFSCLPIFTSNKSFFSPFISYSNLLLLFNTFFISIYPSLNPFGYAWFISSFSNGANSFLEKALGYIWKYILSKAIFVLFTYSTFWLHISLLLSSSKITSIIYLFKFLPSSIFDVCTEFLLWYTYTPPPITINNVSIIPVNILTFFVKFIINFFPPFFFNVNNFSVFSVR